MILRAALLLAALAPAAADRASLEPEAGRGDNTVGLSVPVHLVNVAREEGAALPASRLLVLQLVYNRVSTGFLGGPGHARVQPGRSDENLCRRYWAPTTAAPPSWPRPSESPASTWVRPRTCCTAACTCGVMHGDAQQRGARRDAPHHAPRAMHRGMHCAVRQTHPQPVCYFSIAPPASRMTAPPLLARARVQLHTLGSYGPSRHAGGSGQWLLWVARHC